MQNLMLFPEPSYWAETFLSTAGTAVPIFLRSWKVWQCAKQWMDSNTSVISSIKWSPKRRVGGWCFSWKLEQLPPCLVTSVPVDSTSDKISNWIFVDDVWTSWKSVAFLVEICWHVLLVSKITAMLIMKAMVMKTAYTIIAHSRVQLFPILCGDSVWG